MVMQRTPHFAPSFWGKADYTTILPHTETNVTMNVAMKASLTGKCLLAMRWARDPAPQL